MTSVVSSLGSSRSLRRRLKANLAGFVLGDFVLGVFLAVLAFAVGTAGLGNIDLGRRTVSNSFLQQITV